MSAVNTLEKQIGDLFKGAPKLPEAGKEGLAKAWPWIALIFGVLQLLAAWGLWELTRRSEQLIDTLSRYYTGGTYGLSSTDKLVIYVGIATLLVDALILLKAFPELKKRTKRGWDLLFLGALVNVAYSIVTLFIDDRGIGSFLFSLLASAIGFYLLFQVREKYKGVAASKRAKTTKA